MDHKVSKDMISSGMIPSGEKTQADLGRTQYGSAPSPSSLMDAYKSIYEHHQKDKDGNTIPHEGEQLNEGKMPEGLKNYLMKKGKKKDKEKVEEGMGGMVKAAVKVGKMIGNKMKKEPTKPDTQMNDVDLFDLVKGKLIDEGYEEKDAVKIMANLTKDEFNQISEGLPMIAKAGMAVGGALLAKKGLGDMKKKFDKFINKQRNTSPIGGNTRPGADKIEYGK